MKVPSSASDPLIQSFIKMIEGRVTVELNGLPSEGSDDYDTVKGVVLDLATARTILKLFARDAEMRDTARLLTEQAERTIEAFTRGGETVQDTVDDDLEDDLSYSMIDEEYLFDYSDAPRAELSED